MRGVPAFLMVGATAAAVHQLVVVALTEAGGVPPAWSNLPGFAVAWVVSYLGHRRFTFASTRPHREAAPRFLAVALLAFACNQGLFVALLRFTSLHYAIALFLTLATVAAGTYVLSGRWAFRGVARG